MVATMAAEQEQIVQAAAAGPVILVVYQVLKPLPVMQLCPTLMVVQ